MNEVRRVALGEIIDPEVYRASLDAGYIALQTHPTLPLTIHNYSKSCTWENAWNEATLACRGLITNTETGEVLARPLKKFFNHDQPGAPILDLSDEITVTDKVDGSMGILYPTLDGKFAIATRGSFASDQAIWGTEIWNAKYADTFTPNPAWTYIFEIIVPQNRIVVKYGDMTDLILIGAIETATGLDVDLALAVEGWPGTSVSVFPYKTYGEALEAPARDNAEGFVLYHHATRSRVKIKQAEYIRLHKILTNVNTRSVWEILSTGENPEEIFSDAPDEFHVWLKSVIASFRAAFDAIKSDAEKAYADVLATLPADYARRDFAIAIAKHPMRGFLFLLLDGRSLDEPIWDQLRPVGEIAAQKVFSGGGDDE